MPAERPSAEVDPEPSTRPSRRAVIATPCVAGAVAALGGCSTYGGSAGVQPGPLTAPPATTPPSGPAGDAQPSQPAPAKPQLAALSDVPVGGGKILDDQGIVLTQPSAGTVKAFSSACTHAGCQVNNVSGGTINCPCHGSKFGIADGSVADGPAESPLPPVAVTVDGDRITRA